METVEYHKMHELEHTNWWYAARKHLIHLLLSKYSPHFESILDIGCGTGTILESFPTKQRLGVEQNPVATHYARQKGLTIIPNLESVTGTFDVILLMDVLEHISDDVSFLQNALKKLSTNGIVIVTVPAFQWLWSKHDKHVHHIRRYSKKTLSELILNSGAESMRISYWNATFFLPSLVKKILFSSENDSDLSEMPKLINSTLLHLLNAENKISMSVPVPIGTSVYAVIKKHQ